MSVLVSNLGQIKEKSMWIIKLSVLALIAMFLYALPNVLLAEESPKATAEGKITDLEWDCKQGGHDFLILSNPIIEIDLGGT